MTNKYSDTNPLMVLALIVGFIVCGLIAAKCDYEYRKSIVRDAIRESKQEQAK